MPTPYMVRRHHTWYLRLRVPADLTPFAGQHIVRSLKTSDRTVARAKALGLASAFNGIWMELRQRLAEKLQAYFNREIPVEEMKAFVLEHASEIEAMPDNVKKHFSDWLNVVMQRKTQEAQDVRESADMTATLADMWKQAKQQGMLEGMEKAISLGGLATQAPPAPSILPTPSASTECSEPWTNLIERFHDDNPGQTEKTRVSYRITFTQFQEIVGNKALNLLTKQDIKAYADWLKNKPSLRGGTLGHGTIVRHLGEVKFFLKWCVQSGLIEDKGFADVKARAKTQKEKLTRQEEVRRAFTNDELKQIFNSPLFSGYHSEHFKSRPGYQKKRLTDFWFICVLALTGARIGEISDVPAKLYDLEGISCLDLRQTGTKTGNSPRLIPILPELRKIGFLHYVQKQAQAGLGLMQSRRGEVIKPESWSKRINRYLEDIGLTDKSLVAYSFRHTFRQALRTSDLNMEIINKIFGHETDSVGAGYGSNLSGGEAQAFLDKVKYPIFLDHLADRNGVFLK
ncbi:tyrosine-type recombinase/integrase [Acetobacter lambici]|uniref:Site-specific integrase n=2 Tax=Acetobacter lambici TaxID=1332824 RepID=A0ABT1F1P1_9PROT|nr:DUF6538 domain-containing protein [Acetobacter lambici]MCP1259132.1 site-specific integrase [Acetobacter lambici]NHO57374.1 tyrosine-type recombinase/integrase [Acetobacter lambici]